MKYFLSILVSTLFSVSAFTSESVSIVSLISNPDSYHGKDIIIGGYL